MAKPRKKPGGKRSSGADRHTQPRIGFHLPADLEAALQAYIDATKPTPGKSAVLRLALEEFLEKKGFWPLPPKG